MVSSRESLFWKKNTAFSAECKENGSKMGSTLSVCSPKGNFISADRQLRKSSP